MPKSLKLFFWIIHVTIVFSYPELAQVVPFHRTCFEFSKNRYSCCLQRNVQLQNNSSHPCLSICAEGSSHFDSASSSGAELHLHPSNTALSQDPPSPFHSSKQTNCYCFLTMILKIPCQSLKSTRYIFSFPCYFWCQVYLTKNLPPQSVSVIFSASCDIRAPDTAVAQLADVLIVVVVIADSPLLLLISWVNLGQ